MKYTEYRENLLELKTQFSLADTTPGGLDTDTTKKVEEIVLLIEKVEDELFLGKTEIQPIKIHQLVRIYRLAKTFIEILIAAWPVIRQLLKLFKK